MNRKPDMNDSAPSVSTSTALLTTHGWEVDYLTLRRQADLGAPAPGDRALVLLAAARLGRTRLLDNIEIMLADL